MNKDSWIALIIASIITIVAATPLFYPSDYSRGSKNKISEPMKRTDQISGSTTEPTMSPKLGDNE